MLTNKNKVIVYAQNYFSTENAKTGTGFIRYGLCETVALIDQKLTGKNVSEVLPGLPKIPIFASIKEAKKARPDSDTLLIGIATAGGQFPKEWISDIEFAVNSKLNIVNGLHDFLSDDLKLTELARKNNVWIWDVRKYTEKYLTANVRLLDFPLRIVLTVGTDAALGKMTVSLELAKSAKLQNVSAKFVATGQTGIMISGSGIPIDAITGDFMAGAIEKELLKIASEGYKIAFVEGQGSILHPGWSGVTLALLHGALPHSLVLCHKPGRQYLKNTNVKIESLNQFVRLYEDISLPARKTKVACIALNTFGMPEQKANDAIKRAEDETGLVADDPVRNSGDKLLKECLRLN